MSDTPETPAPSGAPEAPLQPGTGSTSGSNKTKVWLAIGAIVVVALAGFFGARALSGSKKASASNTLPPTSAATGSNNGTGNGRGFGNFANRGTAGKITAIASPNFTVQSVTISGLGSGGQGSTPSTTPGPAVTVKTSSSTRYTVTKTVALSAIAKGDRVIATGAQGTNGITATSITDMGTASANGANGFGGGRRGTAGNGNGSTPPGGGFGGGAPGGATANGQSFAFGTVQSVSANTIVVTTANGTSTVTVGSGAKIAKTESGSFSDLKVGDSVTVTGTKSGATVTATDVRVGNGAGGFGGGFGGGFRGRGNGGAASGQAGS
ncbi:MAG TPA: DUF5666 domain-containing protein [Acidimicrobiia bacterium]|jgi:hypothetical protein